VQFRAICPKVPLPAGTRCRERFRPTPRRPVRTLDRLAAGKRRKFDAPPGSRPEHSAGRGASA